MAELLQQGIGRMRGSAAAPVAGSSFLVAPRYVLTCAHVVNVALGRAWNAPECPEPGATVLVEFPFARRGEAVSASVIEWRAPADGVATDIAVLALERDVPARPYRTIAGLPHRGQTFWTKGFPAGQDGGMDAAGGLGTPIEYGRLLAHGSALPGFFIEGGFSGAPLLDETSGAVIGMAAAATRDETKRTAFVIPADQLEQAWPLLAQPYKGLFTFREEDRRFFFGRDAYIDELAAKLQRLPFVAVVGRSGSGKSSLVRAGLLPRLHEDGDWRILVMRPGAPSAEPFRNLAVCLLDAARVGGPGLGTMLDEDAVARLASALADDPAVLVERLHRLAGDGPDSHRLLLVIDQFEELFTLVADPHPEEERGVRARFVQCLRVAVDTTHTRDPAGRCIVTLRADYLGRALGIRALADLLKDADIKLAPMNAAELRSAIEEPARLLGVRFDDGLVDELMQSVGASLDALPLLEFTLAELWSQQRDRVIHRPRVPAEADAAELLVAPLTRHAEAVFDDLSRRFGEATFRAAMTSLVWLGDPTREGEDTKRLRRRGEFLAAGEEGARQWDLLEQLASQDQRARLVILGASRVDGEPTAEIVHETLIRRWDRLRGWLDEDRGFRLWLQKTEAEAAEWRASKDSSDLLAGRKLAEAQRWQEERRAQDLLPVADYVAASVSFRREREGQEQARQLEHINALQRAATIARRRSLYALCAAILAILAMLGVGYEWRDAAALKGIALAEGARAERRAREADDQRTKALRSRIVQLAAAAESQIDAGDFVTGMLLALDAVRGAPESEPRGFTAEAERALTRGMREQREIRVFLAHAYPVNSVLFSPDGKRLLTASADRSVRLWETETGRSIGVPLLGLFAGVKVVAFSPDGKRLVGVSWDHTLRMWDVESGQQIGAPFVRYSAGFNCVAFSPDGKRLATGTDDGGIELWDAASGQPVGAPLSDRTHAASVAFSPDGQRLSVGTFAKSIEMWDVQNGQQLGMPLLGHGDTVQSVVFSPDGKYLASASDDHTVRLWDVASGRQIGAPLLGHTGGVVSVAFSPDGRRLASASADNSVRLWDVASGRQIGAPLLGHTGGVVSVAFSPDGKRLASASLDDSARLWNAEGESPNGTPLLGHTDTIGSVVFSPDGTLLASASHSDDVLLWNATDARQIGWLQTRHDSNPQQLNLTWLTRGSPTISFSPDGKILAVASSLDNSVRLWDWVSGKQIGEPLFGHSGLINSVAFSPDGKLLASASWDQTVRLWDPVTGQQVALLLGHTDGVNSVGFSPDGKLLATASRDKSLRLWDRESGEQVSTPLLGHTEPVNSVTFSPDGQRLASASSDGTVRLWDVANRRQIGAPLLGHTGLVTSVAFSPHGDLLASASWDDTVRLWDVASGRELSALIGHKHFVTAVAFSPDGKHLASSSDDKTVRIWSVFSRDEVVQAAVARLPRCLSAYQKMTFGVAEAPGTDLPERRLTLPPCW